MNDTPGHGPNTAPRVIARPDHNISRANISPNALRVLYRLKDAGFQGFLVGGCVRDIMLGRTPKDFDVATDALPEQIRDLFRNCRLVGRRFRLAHVLFGREIIEVATFRAAAAPPPGAEPLPDEDREALELEEQAGLDLDEDAEDSDGNGDEDEDEDQDEDEDELEDRSRAGSDAAAAARRDVRSRDDFSDNGIDHERVQDTHGRLLRDNVYGSIDEDVWRRDFTANSLYYNIADFSVWDYVDGVQDIQARRLRLIGDPETRYREDPVRMLRGARFEAKLGFELDAATAAPIDPLRGLLAGVPAARLFDESLKLFLTGHGQRSLEVLRERRLFAVLFPTVERYLAAHPDSLVEKLLIRGLANTDARVAADKPVTPTFLFALLLYGPIAAAIESLPPQRWHEISAIMEACDRALREASARVTIPRRVALGVREMFALQPRLEQPRGRRALRLLEQPRFRAGFDLLLLRAQFGLAKPETAAWWAQLQEASGEERARLADQAPGQPPPAGGRSGAATRGPRRRRRRGRFSSSG